jgi:hypothetical protein
MVSKNTEFAQRQGAGKILPRRICVYMQARNFSPNTAVEMKSVFLEGSFDAR